MWGTLDLDEEARVLDLAPCPVARSSIERPSPLAELVGLERAP